MFSMLLTPEQCAVHLLSNFSVHVPLLLVTHCSASYMPFRCRGTLLLRPETVTGKGTIGRLPP